MARSKLCDFCLEEKGGFFSRLEEVPGGYHICSDCRQKIVRYGLPVRFDLFQQLVIADPSMREMMMSSYLEDHSPSEALGRFYPVGSMILHRGEELITVCPAAIRVEKARIPGTAAVRTITDVQKPDITNLPTCRNDATETETVTGTLYETNAAVYFFTEHFLNVHRLTNLVNDSRDMKAVHVLEHANEFIYQMDNADLFLMRHRFYHIIQAARSNRKQNLIYLSSENTMTLTPGIYSVPRNIKSGSYWLASLDGAGINIRDSSGRTKSVQDGRVDLFDGSLVECAGEYQLRIRNHEDALYETTSLPTQDEIPREPAATFEEVTAAIRMPRHAVPGPDGTDSPQDSKDSKKDME